MDPYVNSSVSSRAAADGRRTRAPSREKQPGSSRAEQPAWFPGGERKVTPRTPPHALTTRPARISHPSTCLHLWTCHLSLKAHFSVWMSVTAQHSRSSCRHHAKPAHGELSVDSGLQSRPRGPCGGGTCLWERWGVKIEAK